MMLKVRFFARLREQLACEVLELPCEPGLNTVAALRSALAARGPEWKHALEDQNLLMAVNQSLAEPATPLSAGDEVAFFPPVTGG